MNRSAIEQAIQGLGLAGIFAQESMITQDQQVVQARHRFFGRLGHLVVGYVQGSKLIEEHMMARGRRASAMWERSGIVPRCPLGPRWTIASLLGGFET